MVLFFFLAVLSAFVPLPSSFPSPSVPPYSSTWGRYYHPACLTGFVPQRKSSKIPVCFNTEISELPAMAYCWRREILIGEEKKLFISLWKASSVHLQQRWKHHSHQMLWCIWGPKAGKDINTPVYTWSLLWILTDNVVVGQRLSRMRAWWGDTRRRRVYDLALSDAMAVNGCFNLLRVISAECYNNIGLGSFSETYVKKINRGSLGDT